MLGINPYLLCHRLFVNPSTCSMSQKKRKLREKKQVAVREEMNKLLFVHFYGTRPGYPMWLWLKRLAKNGECARTTFDLNKACPKIPYQA
ncbi:hypothetical protein CR513_23548, partial [Mucuna pruriens]